ncbi:S41 family peptidase [Phnomibacter ginsenosidimutans]|nr:S41 family peptidase [Phnomibacter ginsenosidimutans]
MQACTGSQYVVGKKYSPAQMQADAQLLWQTYRQVHPSYNWYTPADTVDARFQQLIRSLTDSLPEPEFRLRLAYATADIRCGHTSIMSPKSISKALNNRPGASFPLQVKVWGDSMIVTDNTGPNRDSVKRGVAITHIDSVPVQTLIRQMEAYISVDGTTQRYADAILSASFPSRFRWMYGLKPMYNIQYVDSAGKTQTAKVGLQMPRMPDSNRNKVVRVPAPRPQPDGIKRHAFGFMRMDTARQYAYLRISSFSGNGFKKFVRRSFRSIAKQEMQHVVVDIRDNGGGKISNSVMLARYLSDTSFRIADSVSAVGFDFPKPAAVQVHWFYKLFGWVIAPYKADGRRHMGLMERKLYEPKRYNHFDGQLYVLMNGRSFSASILFLQHLADRPQTVRIGEETGGGARGNSAVMTPDITLPNTRIRARLPLFRIITHATLPDNGRGVMPDIEVLPNSSDIRYRRDAAMQKALELMTQ